MKIGKWIFAAVALMAVVALVGCPSPTRVGTGDPGNILPPGPTVTVAPTSITIPANATAASTFTVTVSGANLDGPDSVTMAEIFALLTGDGVTLVEASGGPFVVTAAGTIAPTVVTFTLTPAGLALVGGATAVTRTLVMPEGDIPGFTLSLVFAAAGVAPALTGINITGPSTVGVGGTIQLTAVAVPDGASLAGLVWASADDAVADVDSDGEVEGVALGGPIDITATVGTIVGTHAVTVAAPLATHTVNNPTATREGDAAFTETAGLFEVNFPENPGASGGFGIIRIDLEALEPRLDEFTSITINFADIVNPGYPADPLGLTFINALTGTSPNIATSAFRDLEGGPTQSETILVSELTSGALSIQINSWDRDAIGEFRIASITFTVGP